MQVSFRCPDANFNSVLNAIRTGHIDVKVRKLLISRNFHKAGRPPNDTSNPVIKLVGLKRDAQAHNAKELAKLTTQQIDFDAQDSGVTQAVSENKKKNAAQDCNTRR